MSDTKKTILVVDDEKTNLVRARMLLQEEYNPILVNCGEQCLRYLENHKPDLILLDIMMPDLSGWQVLEQIRKNPEKKDIPVIFLTADSNPTTESASFAAGAVDFILKPIQPTGMLSRIRRVLELEEYRRNLKEIVQKQQKQILDMKYRFVVNIANLVDNRNDEAMGDHIGRTAQMVKLLALALRQRGFYTDILTDTYIDQLYLAAPMHDIGKIKISDSILAKPGRLTEEEFSIVKEHTVFGREVLKETLTDIEDEEFIKIACDVAAYHHEKYNGKGYPEGLCGEEIPLCARIMAVADVYDALKEPRCYKEAFPLEEVYEIMQEDAGSHFDPTLIRVFMEIREEIEKLG